METTRQDAPDATPVATERPRIGRAPVTTHGELGHIALTLFLERGFDQTTVDDIAAAAGIGRRTLFRYFPSKNDLAWGDFDALLMRMREHLASIPDSVPLMEALRQAAVEFNRFPDEERSYHRKRMALLLTVPSLVAHSSLRYESWRQVVAEYVSGRCGEPVDGLTAQSIAWACLGLCLASYEQWLAHEDADLLELLDTAFARLGAIFGVEKG